METITVQATYSKGVLKPAKKLNIPEGSKVEVKITTLPILTEPAETTFASLEGIWSHLSDVDLDRLDRAVVEIRNRSTYKIDRLWHQLGEDPTE